MKITPVPLWIVATCSDLSWHSIHWATTNCTLGHSSEIHARCHVWLLESHGANEFILINQIGSDFTVWWVRLTTDSFTSLQRSQPVLKKPFLLLCCIVLHGQQQAQGQRWRRQGQRKGEEEGKDWVSCSVTTAKWWSFLKLMFFLVKSLARVDQPWSWRYEDVFFRGS